MTVVFIGPCEGDPVFDAAVKCEYHPTIVDWIKNLIPGRDRRWWPERKIWLIKSEWVGPLTAVLEEDGFTVRDGRGKRQEAPRRNTPPPKDSWADGLMSAVGPDRREAAYKALVKVCHPDLGGTDELMKQLNAARDKVNV